MVFWYRQTNEYVNTNKYLKEEKAKVVCPWWIEVKLNKASTFDNILNSLPTTESHLVYCLSSKEFPIFPSLSAFNKAAKNPRASKLNTFHDPVGPIFSICIFHFLIKSCKCFTPREKGLSRQIHSHMLHSASFRFNLLLFFFWFVLFPFQLITLMLLESYSNRNVPDFLQCKHPAFIPWGMCVYIRTL